MKLFTLIHICRDEKSLINSNADSFDAQIGLYLNCARQLYFSLKHKGVSLEVLTNDKALLSRLNGNLEGPAITEIPFKLQVPKGILFYSAHYKIEVFEYLSALKEDYVGLVDSDVLCINDMPLGLRNAIAAGIPLYYDITDQVSPAYGAHTIIKDKEALGIKDSVGLWAGGEFLAGPPAFFGQVVQQIKKVETQYFSKFKQFHHQGDEVLTSVAIEALMREAREPILEAGSLSVIGRFWNARTKHAQKPLHGYHKHFLIHLPADKAFFSKIDLSGSNNWDFDAAYKKHLTTTKFTRPYQALKRMLKK